ncbi:MAG: GntR family transcriptional regulator / MocR family aminotransferase [Thermomicrobiales bacterium]|jgi:GntR family transcriptional regulator/MocR family aminotransferase|nr:GntR family transcriptional regulator / MocR family aminotransferase [Thermomicrobiales bacterium]
MPPRADLDLPIRIDRGSRVPVHQQVAEALRRAIRDGVLAPGARLPSTRALSEVLGIARNVALVAFDELYAEGYAEGRPGSGTYVARDLPAAPRPMKEAPISSARWKARAVAAPIEAADPPGCISFRLGVPSTSPLAPEVWRRMWREVGDREPPSGYAAPAGEPRLRAAVAAYLGRSRGVTCSADELVITTGAAQALDLLVQATLDSGEEAAIEEPGYPTARRILQLRGARLVPVPVDEDGLRVDSLPSGGDAPVLVYVTPSHQYPVGVRMSIGRRLALLEWATTNDALVVEDDYDGEFRFGAPPLPALAGLDRAGRVAYVGTFSKILMPGLRVGYLLAPRPLRERVMAIKRLTDYHTPWPEQQALAGFCERGELERHVRRMRRYYAENRAVLAATLAPIAELARLRGLEAGLHAYLELRDDLDPERVGARCRERGVVVSTLADYFAGPPDRQGLLLGYGGLDPHDVRNGATVVAAAVRDEASCTGEWTVAALRGRLARAR